jgi:hypothetical protein
MKHTTCGVDRRAFLFGGASLLGSVALASAAAPVPARDKDVVRFGMIADLHHSFFPHAQPRLAAFLTEAEQRPLDFLIQLGDLIHGYTPKLTPDQQLLLNTWNSVRLPSYNVLGNHEMDRCSKQVAMGYLEMQHGFYSFDQGGIHFVVLDCNHVLDDGKYVDYDRGNYYHFKDAQINWVDSAQMDWLKEDLRSTGMPTIVFTHPCVHPYWGSNSAVTEGGVRALFMEINKDAGWQKIVACFSGHEHANEHEIQDGVHYLLINSASYYYTGDNYGDQVSLGGKFKDLATYRDPLYCFVTINKGGIITIEGRNSSFLIPTPTETRFPDARYLSASISTRHLPFLVKS